MVYTFILYDICEKVNIYFHFILLDTDYLMRYNDIKRTIKKGETMYYISICPSPLGMLTLASNGTKLIGLWMEHQKYFGGNILSEATVCDDLPIFEKTKDWLTRYFKGQQPPIEELPLAPIGTEFQRAVWQLLCEIPYGEVTTYGEIAKKLGLRSAQAVGGAVGRNPISVIIPCHRVVGTNGALTGYAGGLERKAFLLQLEKEHQSGGI